MKTKNPIKRHVAEKALIHLHQQLISNPPNFEYEIGVFYFLLDLFYRLRIYNKDLKEKDNWFIEISKNYFQAYIPHGYKRYITYLKAIGLYQCDNHFDKKKHICLGYKLNGKFESGLNVVEINPNSSIWKKITENFNEKNHKKQSDIEKQMKKELSKLETDFDFNAALVFLQDSLQLGTINQTQYNVNKMSIEAIRDKKYYLKRNRTNFRVDSNLTNMKKELREFLKGYTQIDLVNSQPYLLNFLINHKTEKSRSYKYSNLNSINSNNNSSDNPIQSLTLKPPSISSCGAIHHTKALEGLLDRLFKEIIKAPDLNAVEVDNYYKLTQTGKVYEYFMDELKVSRAEAKELFIGALYAPNNSKNFKKEQELFKTKFPTIARLLWNLKTKTRFKDYADLPIALQTLESEIFIDNIATRLYAINIPIFTVHDSVIVKVEYQDQVMKIMQEVFQSYFGEAPSFKIQSLDPANLAMQDECIRVKKTHQKLKQKPERKYDDSSLGGFPQMTVYPDELTYPFAIPEEFMDKTISSHPLSKTPESRLIRGMGKRKNSWVLVNNSLDYPVQGVQQSNVAEPIPLPKGTSTLPKPKRNEVPVTYYYDLGDWAPDGINKPSPEFAMDIISKAEFKPDNIHALADPDGYYVSIPSTEEDHECRYKWIAFPGYMDIYLDHIKTLPIKSWYNPIDIKKADEEYLYLLWMWENNPVKYPKIIKKRKKIPVVEDSSCEEKYKAMYIQVAGLAKAARLEEEKRQAVEERKKRITALKAAQQMIEFKEFGDTNIGIQNPDDIKQLEEGTAISGSSCQAEADHLGGSEIINQEAVSELLAYNQQYMGAVLENNIDPTDNLTEKELKIYWEFHEKSDAEHMALMFSDGLKE